MEVETVEEEDSLITASSEAATGSEAVTTSDAMTTTESVPDELRQQVIQFIRDHHHVINSPIARDTNRIPDPNKKGKWIRKTSCYYNVQCVSY